jgi:hypothetical protein
MSDFKSRILSQYICDKYQEGKITIREAAVTLYNAGWTTFIDEDYAKKILGLTTTKSES